MSAAAAIQNPKQSVRYWLGRAFLQTLGWRAEGKPPEVAKCVVIAAPHTSNWDGALLLAISYVLGVRVQFMMKHTAFRWPMGAFFRSVGAIPIDRRSRNNTVEQCIEHFRQRDEFMLAVPPEGTRGKVNYWKTGFYHIAEGAKVPLVLGFLDYKRKVGGLGPTIWTTGDIHADVARIREFYTGIMGKYPEKMSEIAVPPMPADKGAASTSAPASPLPTTLAR